MWSCACSNMGLLASRRAWPFAFPLPPRETASVFCLRGSWRCHALAVSDPLFRASDLALATAAGLRAISAVAPPGTHYTPRSLRSGDLSRVRGWRSVGTHNAPEQPRVYRGVLRHYLDPLMPQTPAARIFFERFVPAPHALSGPAAPVSSSFGIPTVRAPSPARGRVVFDAETKYLGCVEMYSKWFRIRCRNPSKLISAFLACRNRMSKQFEFYIETLRQSPRLKRTLLTTIA
jgi:hypothetical protein